MEEDCDTVTISLVYDKQINAAAFGGAALYVGDFGETFEYYDSGLLKSVQNDFGSSIQLQYDNNMNPNNILQKYQDEVLKEIEITYDNHHNVIQTVTSGITTDYYYDGTQDGSTTYGVITEIVSTTDDLTTSESMTYTSDFNYLTSYTDSSGMTSVFNYDTLSGQLLSATDPEGNQVEYEYDSDTGELLAVAGQADPNTLATTSFDYAQGLLREISRNGVTYQLGYDDIGRQDSVVVGNTTLVLAQYDVRQRIAEQTYANGDSYAPTYDNKNRVIGETYNNGISNEPNFSYTYNLKNQMSRLIDRENATTWNYSYDVSGRLASMRGTNGTQAEYTYNAKTNKLGRLTLRQNGDTISDTEYAYADDGRPIEAMLYSMNDTAVSYSFDGLNRLEQVDLGALQFGYEYIEAGGGGAAVAQRTGCERK